MTRTLPTLVLLPGMDGTGILFRPFLQTLAVGLPVKVVAYPVDKPMGYDELGEFVLSALPAEGPVVLLGESFSGPIAAALAVRLGDRVRGLILCCTFMSNPRPALGPLLPFAGLLPFAALPVGLTARPLLGSFVTPALKSLLAEALALVSSAVLRARLKSVVTVDATEALAAVKVPVLYLQASSDALVPTSAVRQAQKACPAMTVQVIHGPHCLLQVAPADAAAAVCAFVREVDA